MEHSRNFDELMVALIGNTLRRKVSVENFDELITNRQNSSDFSSVKILRYTVLVEKFLWLYKTSLSSSGCYTHLHCIGSSANAVNLISQQIFSKVNSQTTTFL